MIRLVALLSRKPGTTPEQFREYYETRHVPLIESMNPYMSGYTRDYIRPGTGIRGNLADGPGEWLPGYDVVTMVSFASQEDFDKARAALGTDENRALIAADEENFLDRSAKMMFLTDMAGTNGYAR
jgi:uncharacterized protein (TIGR02118 family)